MISRDLLVVPVDLDDANDHREQLENLMIVQRQFLERTLYQYGGAENWITTYLREGLQAMESAHERILQIINYGNLPQSGDQPKPME